MKRELRLVTWNVNGLRAVLQRLELSLLQFLESLKADIICLQETKMTRSELDEELVRPPGFDAFYSFSRHKGGYSGVVTFVKSDLPTVAAEEGLTGLWQTKDSVGHVGSLHDELPSKLVNDLEAEGRCIITDHQAFVLLNVYCPALASVDRLEYKLQFHLLLEDRVKVLRAANRHVIVVGDVNIAHREIDHCNPDAHRMDGNSFADHPCRRWMDSFLGVSTERIELASPSESDSGNAAPRNMIDAFRHLHPNETKRFTCWNTQTGARQTNYGTRIDYILVDSTFLESISSCNIEADRLGSDHCPVVMTCNVMFETDPSSNHGITAALCAKNFVEFSGTQQSISSFKRQNSGQQSITSFFSHTQTNRTASSSAKDFWSEQELSTYQMVSGSVQLTERSTSRKPVEEERLEWTRILSGRPPPTPLCYCGQPTVLRSVLKANENWGRKFYVCTKPAGEKGNPDARCDFFKWADNKNLKKRKTPGSSEK
eukprot:jgi/Phyca11/109958/e_gw1.17.253.1